MLDQTQLDLNKATSTQVEAGVKSGSEGAIHSMRELLANGYFSAYIKSDIRALGYRSRVL